MRLLSWNLSLLLGPALLALGGCGSGLGGAHAGQAALTLTPGTSTIDTNCTGCNATGAGGGSVEQFRALAGGGAAEVSWSVAGGDAASGPGSINVSGQYTPPSYLTADRAVVVVTAALKANPSVRARAVLTVTPGFLQPLTPENVAVGANGSVNITGFLAEAGGTTGIHFALANAAAGQAGIGQAGGGQTGSEWGSLSAVSCQRDGKTFTSCTVTYTAPATVQTAGTTYVVATAGDSQARTSAVVLVNAAGVTSNAAAHQTQLPALAELGSSGGNNADYDTRGGRIVDCCSGTLGALVEDGSRRAYVLSNNHVLARGDQASVGEMIVQPGLIDNNCTPFGDEAGPQPASSIAPVAFLTGWLPLNSTETNVDAAIAQVAAHAVDPAGDILELGGRLGDGTLTAAPPGISSTGGRGENASLDLQVAKSGRTTGLTCGGVSAVDLDVKVEYFHDCAETEPYMTKTFTNQFGVSGNQFSDAGDSGALIVDAADAEPVGLLFAGGMDTAGVSQAVANPAPEVLNELGAQLGGGPYTFVGGADHAVNCLSYGDSTIAAAQARTLSDAETARAAQALGQARMMVNPAAGILGVATGKSSDHAGEAAVIVYTAQGKTVSVPQTVDGVRTVVIPTTARAVADGSAPLTPWTEGALSSPALAAAEAVKAQAAAGLMQQNAAFFGVGVGQSLDNPTEAALVIYVDRNRIPVALPETVDGLRTRYIVMDRLHVTRSYDAAFPSRAHCVAHRPEFTLRPAPFAARPLSGGRGSGHSQ